MPGTWPGIALGEPRTGSNPARSARRPSAGPFVGAYSPGHEALGQPACAGRRPRAPAAGFTADGLVGESTGPRHQRVERWREPVARARSGPQAVWPPRAKNSVGRPAREAEFAPQQREFFSLRSPRRGRRGRLETLLGCHSFMFSPGALYGDTYTLERNMNKRTQGMQYRVLVLRALARLGYATTRQLAKMVWWRCDGSTRKMAGRTLRWLIKRGYIVTRRDRDSVNGEQLSAVTTAGAAWLAKHGEPLPYGKAHARDWLRHAHNHRTACNSVYAAMAGLFPDSCAWSELEIRAGLSPLGQLTYSLDGVAMNKIPDVLVQRLDGLVWVEVENGWRSDRDLAKVVASMRAMSVDRRIKEVHFIITAPGAKTIGERLTKRLTHPAESGWPRQVKERDARLLAQYIKVSSLNNDTLELSPVVIGNATSQHP